MVMNLSGIEEAVRLAQERWPHIEPKIKTRHEAACACPVCGGDDRWVLFENGFHFCRPGPGHCAKQGWIDDDQKQQWSPAEIRMRRIEAEQARARRERHELKRQMSALKRMAECTDHQTYHSQLDEAGFEWCATQGLQMSTVFEYKIGQCNSCPTDKMHRPSYTFPVWRRDGPLWTIRHRIKDAHSDKYRPHLPGLGTQLVNARKLPDWSDKVIIIEGCKKTRVVGQYDIPVVGILGKGAFEDRWLSWFHPSASIYLALDPDAQESAERLGHQIARHGKPTYIAHFPAKPDDMFVDGATPDEWMNYIHLARRVH